MNMPRCIFHIDLDAFFVSVEQALHPELRGKPVIVGGDLCPQAIFIIANFPHYRDASARFMEILAHFCPNIEPLGLDEGYLDVTECLGSADSPQKLALSIKERIHKELNLTASVGIATCKVVAKIASDLCKPDGLLEIAPGEERNFLNPLSVGKLPGVGKKTEQILKQMGITTIGELAHLPIETMKRRFGSSGIIIHQYANGIDERRVEMPGEPKSISQQITFAKDTLDCRFLEANLRSLCQEIGEELRRQDKQARCVVIRLRYADFKTITRQVTLTEASTAQVIFARALQLLNKALSQEQRPVRLIGVRASNLTGKERQLGMFDPEIEKRKHLDMAIDQIRRKYGSAAIKTGKTYIASLFGEILNSK